MQTNGNTIKRITPEKIRAICDRFNINLVTGTFKISLTECCPLSALYCEHLGRVIEEQWIDVVPRWLRTQSGFDGRDNNRAPGKTFSLGHSDGRLCREELADLIVD